MRNARNTQTYLDAYDEGFGQVKRKADKPKAALRVNAGQFQKFKALWDSLNRDVVLRYELDADVLMDRILQRITADFQVLPLTISNMSN